MKPNLAYIILCILHLSTKAQNRSFTDYYFEAKALTDTLKTYQVLVRAHGETHPFVSNEYLKDEVGRSFNFLNIKKKVDEDPDFIITIIVSDVNADVSYISKGKNGDYDEYDIIWDYEVSFALSFKSKGNIVHIPLCTKKHFRKQYVYSRRNPEFNSSIKKRNATATLDENQKPVEQYVEELKTALNTKGTFLLEFNEELVKFRKKK